MAVTGQTPDTVAAAERELPQGTLVLRADARSMAETDAATAAIQEHFGLLDLLFLNAGVSRHTAIGDVTEKAFDDLVAVNLKGPYFTLQKPLPLLADGGSIVFTIGVAGRRGMAGGTATTAARGGLLALIPSLALELAPRGIRVNAVSPRAIDTPIWDKLGVPAQAREAMTSSIPFGRFGTADEIAELVAFLGSRASSYITGQDIAVAGGA